MNVFPDPRTPIKVKCGEQVTITCESLPSSGYTWNAGYDPEILELIPKKLIESPGIGSIGQEIFEFRTRRPGKTKIQLNYQRSWEKTPLESKQFTVNILQ